MLRLFYLGAVSIALNPTTTKIAFSRPISASSQYPEVQNFNNIDVPLCYIQTTDGRTLDLHKLCGISPINTINKSQFSRVPKAKFRRGSGSGYASDRM